MRKAKLSIIGSYSEANNPLTPVSNKSQITSSFSPPINPVAQAFSDSGRRERTAEEARLAKRQRRKAVAAGEASSLETGGSGPGTPGTLGDVAPDVDAKKSAPKKAKGQMDNATQAQQFAALNKTTQMALGGKQLSWMKKGQDSGPSNPYLARPNTNSPKTAAGEGGSQVPKARVFGDFREDKEGGQGIQLRDLLSALGESGKEKKSIQKAYAKVAN